ncbi:hypothetical protein CC78DRAFT_90422 [Lojkania enalia]|uniref:DUF3328 domain-containing protein n=1 Tax=Lojkania enalia TaxID=147567 RepID=A0A9P4K3L9_9PLEO|nr:hypothetical protein CC78DRAFT_90422 [Didymosphaeria enalia]
MSNEEFRLLSDHDSADDDEDAESVGHLYTRSRKTLFTAKATSVLLILLTSITFNVVLLFKSHQTTIASSPYLKLAFDSDDTLWWNTEYSSENETEVDALWMRSIPWESGIIAMTNGEAAALDLPESQPWPWDSEKKRIYIINAHHILHCVRNLYISLQEYRHDKNQSVAWPHLLHCLDSIRQDTMCMADDTPRYVPLNAVHGFRPGDGQNRKCRNWDAIQQFVGEHDPCYKYIQPGNKELSNLERFQYCPDDSQYLPKIRQYFGYDESWLPSKDGA